MVTRVLWTLGEILVVIAVLAWLVIVFGYDPMKLRDDGILGALESLVGFLVPTGLVFAGWTHLRDQHKPADKRKIADN